MITLDKITLIIDSQLEKLLKKHKETDTNIPEGLKECDVTFLSNNLIFLNIFKPITLKDDIISMIYVVEGSVSVGKFEINKECTYIMRGFEEVFKPNEPSSIVIVLK